VEFLEHLAELVEVEQVEHQMDVKQEYQEVLIQVAVEVEQLIFLQVLEQMRVQADQVLLLLEHHQLEH
jgi:hypothetical protein